MVTVPARLASTGLAGYGAFPAVLVIMKAGRYIPTQAIRWVTTSGKRYSQEEKPGNAND